MNDMKLHNGDCEPSDLLGWYFDSEEEYTCMWWNMKGRQSSIHLHLSSNQGYDVANNVYELHGETIWKIRRMS